VIAAILMMLTTPSAVPVISPRASRFQSMVFECNDRKSFRVEIFKTSAVVRTLFATYRLPRRNSSIGQRFVSDQAAFALDENRGVFITGNEAPYDGCHLKSRIIG